ATLEACRSVWAQFHAPGMVAGIGLMLLGLVVLVASLRSEVSGEAAKWTAIAAVPAAIYAANSFILYEDALFFYLLQSALVVAAVRSPPRRAALMVAAVANTAAFQITVCREEQIGCRNTFHTTTVGALAGFAALIARTWWSNRATWRTRILGTLLVAYWLVEEEFAGAVDRVWPVWIARMHVVLVALFSLTPRRAEREGTLLLYCLLAQFHRPVGMLALWAADMTLSALPAPAHPMTHVLAHCLIRFVYFASGHQATLSSIHWSVGHTGMYTTNFVLSPIAVALNTVGHVIPLVAAVPSPWVLVALETVHLIASSAMAMHLRRHLMVWKVFAPRWMLSGLLLVTVAGVAVVVDT
ncbi:mannose-ethanolamine phosphotransferase gpi13, partial [Allomyces arbusculus]